MHIKALLMVAFPVCQKCKYFFYHMFFKDVFIYELMHLPVFIFAYNITFYYQKVAPNTT